MQIEAAVARNVDGAFDLERIDLADPRADEVLVRLVATGICHTDYAIIEQIMPIPLPMILGHEGAGVVERVGADVVGLAPGDHVVMTFDSCGTCEECRNGHPGYCAEYPIRNFAGGRTNGEATHRDASGERVGGAFFSQSSFATYALSRQRNTIKVRKDAPLELLGPLACGLSTGAGTVMNVLRPGAGHTLAVFGTGAVGFGAIFAAKAMGVGRIVAIDRVASRLALARETGATDVIDTSREDLAEALAALGGIDFGIDTSGVPALVRAATDALKQRGTLALLGASKQSEVTLNILPLISGKVIRGVVGGDIIPSETVPKLVDMVMDGSFPIDRLVEFYTLDRINDGLRDTLSGKTIKPILRIGATAG